MLQKEKEGEKNKKSSPGNCSNKKMIILHGVALLLSTAVANITSVALSCQD